MNYLQFYTENFCLFKPMAGSVSPILFEVGIPNLVYGYILGCGLLHIVFRSPWSGPLTSVIDLSLGAKCRVDNLFVTLTELSRSPSFKILSYEQVVGFSPNLHWCIVWKGKRINKILVTLTLFPWSHQHFVISKVNQICVLACYLLK